MARQRAASRRPSEPRAGRSVPLPPWIAVLVLVGGSAWAARELTRHAERRGVGVVDTSRFNLHQGAAYSHPSWRDRVARVLFQTGGELDADEPAAIAALSEQLASLSFVAEVGTPEVIWPDGLSLPLLYRRPVACVRVGDVFLPADGEGAILLGKSVTPHEAYGAWLPVIGRYERTLELARPGDRLAERRHQQGLAVAASMWEHLAPEDIAVLGRMVIDAGAEYAPDGLPGGVVIDLEERRRILFGRPPLARDANTELADPVAGAADSRAGELPLQDKWANIGAAARALREGQDWVLFDARWDVPEVIVRGSEFDLTLATSAGGG